MSVFNSFKRNIYKLLLVVAIFFVCISLPLTARSALYFGEDYEISLKYNDTVFPGDVIVVTMQFTATDAEAIMLASEGLPKATIDSLQVKARLVFSNALTGKEEQTISFYTIDTKKSILQAAVPLSTYEQAGDYAITVYYSAFSNLEMKFMLPVVVEKKAFESERIPLNASNTAIKTDSSLERISQIDRLNAVLATIDMSAVYQTQAFTSPLSSTRITANFGDRRIYVYVNGKTETSLHYGIDYGVPTGTSVFSCGSGKVVMAENRVSTGFSVVIEHLPGLYSLYYHLDSYSVNVGDIVKQGDLIGLSGSTGLATGPHLHWEMRWNSVAVNPDFFTTYDFFRF